MEKQVIINPHSSTILAIDPGTREIGIAILQDAELVFYGVKTIRNQKTPRALLNKVSAIISRYIAEYQPQYVGLKKPLVLQRSAGLVAVVAEQVKTLAQQQGLSIREYDGATVRRFICQTGKANKRNMAEIIASRYVELAGYSERTMRVDQLYYAKIFEAIGTSLICQRDVSV